MIIVNARKVARTLLGLGLFGLLPLLGGCDDNKSDKPAAAPDPAKTEAERSAREKAYGTGGSPVAKPGAKAAEKPAAPAEKPAEK